MRALVLVAVVATACGSVSSEKPDARTADANTGDAPTPKPTQGAALLSAAGHLTATGWTVDVQVGTPIAATSSTSGADQFTTAGTLVP